MPDRPPQLAHLEYLGDATKFAEPIRALEHFCRLMAEHLAKTRLLAPVGELRLEAIGVQALTEDSASLLPDTVRTGETLYLTLERIAEARFVAAQLRCSYFEFDDRGHFVDATLPEVTMFVRRRLGIGPGAAPR